MSLHTLDIGEDQFRQWTVKCDVGDVTAGSAEQVTPAAATSTASHSSSRGSQQKQKRSRKDPRRGDVEEWLNILPKVPSHYCRASSSKVYVECTFRSHLHMYDVYCEFAKSDGKIPVSRMVFLDVMKNKNVAIHSPRKDQCFSCFCMF